MNKPKPRTQQEIFNDRMKSDLEFAKEYNRRRLEREEASKTSSAVIEALVEHGKPIVDHALAEAEETGEPGLSGWGRTHMSVQAREQHKAEQTMRAHWRNPGESGLTDQNAEPARLPDVGKVFGHKEAGLLHLVATGDGGWLLRLRGAEYGIGQVGRRERVGDELRPSRRTLEAAAARALREGPENPPDAVMFAGDEELTIAEYMRRNKLV